jgi:hypothetical protein
VEVKLRGLSCVTTRCHSEGYRPRNRSRREGDVIPSRRRGIAVVPKESCHSEPGAREAGDEESQSFQQRGAPRLQGGINAGQTSNADRLTSQPASEAGIQNGVGRRMRGHEGMRDIPPHPGRALTQRAGSKMGTACVSPPFWMAARRTAIPHRPLRGHPARNDRWRLCAASQRSTRLVRRSQLRAEVPAKRALSAAVRLAKLAVKETWALGSSGCSRFFLAACHRNGPLV